MYRSAPQPIGSRVATSAAYLAPPQEQFTFRLEPNSIYITLQYLRTEVGVHRYHWGLYATQDRPPEGCLFHATDERRAPMDLFYQRKEVSTTAKSKTMVVNLKVATAPSAQQIDRCVRAIPLMDNRCLPKREARWTCRVWVKEALRHLAASRLITLARDLDTIERCAWVTADDYRTYRIPDMAGPSERVTQQAILPKPIVFNDLTWLSVNTAGRVTQMDIDWDRRFLGPSPMNLDTTTTTVTDRRSVPRTVLPPTMPMDIDPTATGRQQRQQQQPERYYGSKPMVTETHRGHGSSKRGWW